MVLRSNKSLFATFTKLERNQQLPNGDLFKNNPTHGYEEKYLSESFINVSVASNDYRSIQLEKCARFKPLILFRFTPKRRRTFLVFQLHLAQLCLPPSVILLVVTTLSIMVICGAKYSVTICFTQGRSVMA